MTTLSLRYESSTMEAYDVDKNGSLGTMRIFKNMNDYRSSGSIVIDDRLYNWNRSWFGFGRLRIDEQCPNKEIFGEAISRFV